MSNPQNPAWGPLPIARVPNQPAVPQRMVSISNTQDQGGPNYRYGGLLTYEKPILEWYADIVIPPGQLTTLRAGVELPNNCVQVRFVNVLGNPSVGFNGFGGRALFNMDAYNNTEIQSLTLSLGAGDTVTVQAAGTGD